MSVDVMEQKSKQFLFHYAMVARMDLTTTTTLAIVR